MRVIASYNGLAATEKAWQQLQQGSTPLDACVEGITLVEDDPDEWSVGYGGLPNEDGIVELDAAVMDGPTHRGGGVAGLRNVRHPTKVARLVMQHTKRVLLVGEGALQFARAHGFAEENLLTDKARRIWLLWKRLRSEIDDWRTPAWDTIPEDERAWFEKYFGSALAAARGGTVHVAAVDGRGDLACATSTSGHAFKLPGRVGDSPILGAGLYVDNEIGSCGSIGHGEANLENLTSFAAVQLMASGKAPVDAGVEALRQVARKTRRDQCDERGWPKFNLQLFLLAKDGRYAGVCMRGQRNFTVTDENGPRVEPCVSLAE